MIFFVYSPRSSSTFLTWAASRRMLNTVRNGCWCTITPGEHSCTLKQTGDAHTDTIRHINTHTHTHTHTHTYTRYITLAFLLGKLFILGFTQKHLNAIFIRIWNKFTVRVVCKLSVSIFDIGNISFIGWCSAVGLEAIRLRRGEQGSTAAQQSSTAAQQHSSTAEQQSSPNGIQWHPQSSRRWVGWPERSGSSVN